MKARYPRHQALYLLLKNKQYEACLSTAEEMIEELIHTPAPEFPADEAPAEVIRQMQQHDHELACLHLVACLALFGVSRFREAAEKADIAAFLARKLNDRALLAESLCRSGVCYNAKGAYPLAIQRLTECVETGTEEFMVDALYNRGFAYHSLGSFQSAIPDYQEVMTRAEGMRPDMVRTSRINLAWVMILSRNFDQAEQLLAHMASANPDQLVQLHVMHDRAHMAYLRGDAKEAVKKAILALQSAGKQNTHVRGRIALTLMGVAADLKMPREAFILGLLVKRLAAQAKRSDLDAEVSRRMQELEFQAGTQYLTESLQKFDEVLRGATAGRRTSKNGVGGVA